MVTVLSLSSLVTKASRSISNAVINAHKSSGCESHVLTILTKINEQVTEIAREIEESGEGPPDLKNLVSKPHARGTVDGFKQHALSIHNETMKGSRADTWQKMVAGHNAFDQDLVQSNECPPAQGGETDQDKSIQGLIAKMVDQ